MDCYVACEFKWQSFITFGISYATMQKHRLVVHRKAATGWLDRYTSSFALSNVCQMLCYLDFFLCWVQISIACFFFPSAFKFL